MWALAFSFGIDRIASCSRPWRGQDVRTLAPYAAAPVSGRRTEMPGIEFGPPSL